MAGGKFWNKLQSGLRSGFGIGTEVGKVAKKILEFLRNRTNLIIAIVALCVILAVALNTVFSTSFTVTCDYYCKSQPHVACVGYWEISGEYPNCDCRFTCWSSRTCSSDYDCKSGERCYSSYIGGEQAGDLICHPLCESKSDCPESMPYCRRMNITLGGSSDLVDMCMMEECAKDSDCSQPRCMGMRAVCDSGSCKIVDMQGLPARC